MSSVVAPRLLKLEAFWLSRDSDREDAEEEGGATGRAGGCGGGKFGAADERENEELGASKLGERCIDGTGERYMGAGEF